MALIKGITVLLHNQIQDGEDPFGAPVYREMTIKVPNVLVGEPTSQQIVDMMSLYGKRAQYTLALPKGDDHVWEDQIVEFFGDRWRVFTKPVMGIEKNIPLDWNAKVMVERYE
ncbi:hypothetical protein [Moryella indoligenes]|uniref:hypothetical protein n=1 Tax=Moryella indoligenes TaxID=371674 RepID=UPI0027D8454B|nr:hypothetical protein [Moryella indoligenes]